MLVDLCKFDTGFTPWIEWSSFISGDKWADPGGTAIPGQPLIRLEQAPSPYPLTKMSLISKGTHGPRIRY